MRAHFYETDGKSQFFIHPFLDKLEHILLERFAETQR